MTSRRQSKSKNKDFVKYYDAITIFLLVISLIYLLSILFSGVIVSFIFFLIIGFLSYQMALKENRNPVRWFCFGILLNIFVILLRLIIEVKETDPMIVRYREICQAYEQPKESLQKRNLLKGSENIFSNKRLPIKEEYQGIIKFLKIVELLSF